MPKKVVIPKDKQFQFVTKKGGKEGRYDWDTWFSGDLLMIEQSLGEKDDKGNVVKVTERRDYEAATVTMPSKIGAAARRMYKVVQISRYDADGERLEDALIIKARNMTKDERQKEDERRAEVKELLAARRAEQNGAEGEGDEAE